MTQDDHLQNTISPHPQPWQTSWSYAGQEPLHREVWLILHLATIRGIISLSMECIELPLGESSKPPPTSTTQCSGRILGIIGQVPSVSKPKQLHVDVYRFFIVKLKNILQTPLNRSAITFLKSSTSTSYFSNSTRSSALAVSSARLLLQTHQNMCTNRPHTSRQPILKEDENQSLNVWLSGVGGGEDKLLLKEKKKKIPWCWDKLINSRCMHKDTKMLGSCYYLLNATTVVHQDTVLDDGTSNQTQHKSAIHTVRMSGHKVCMRAGVIW